MEQMDWRASAAARGLKVTDLDPKIACPSAKVIHRKSAPMIWSECCLSNSILPAREHLSYLRHPAVKIAMNSQG